MNNNNTIEPGLLSVFRIFMGLRLFFALLAAFSEIVRPADGIRSFDIIETAGILFLLWLPALRIRQNRMLLALAIFMASVGPVISLAVRLDSGSVDKFPLDTLNVLMIWGVMPSMFLPLVLIAWQYRFKQVVLFSFGTTILHIGLTNATIGSEVFESVLVTASLATRIMTFLVLGWLVTRLMSAQRQHRDALQTANRRLTTYAATLEQLATTRERNRLARELHDTLAHTLSSIAVQLEAADALWDTNPDRAHQRFNQSLEAARSGLTETRRALQDLRASPVEDLGLALAIRDLARLTAHRAGIALDIYMPNQINDIRIEIEQAIYRIAQEVLANVAYHANAKHVMVRMIQTDRTLTVTIADDGIGFLPDDMEKDNQWGLRGLCERAEMIGGSLSIESKPGQGTLVCLTVEV